MSTEPHTNKSEASTNPDQEVGLRIRTARESINFTQNVVSSRSRLVDPEGKGISRTALIGYENGSSRPGLREIRLLCSVLKVSPNWLIFGTESAYQATLPSLDFSSTAKPFRNALRAGVAISALKGHERDALLSLAFSLAGRQLGDLRLSGLMAWVSELSNEIETLLYKRCNIDKAPESLEELVDLLSRQHASNIGNRLKFDEEGEASGEWTYPEPDRDVEKPDK